MSVVLFYLVYRLFYKGITWADLSTPLLECLKSKRIFVLLAAILLMPLNWIFESKKWQISLSTVHEISLFESIKSVLMGVALGIITPAKIGEYGGRIINLPSKYRKAGGWSTLLCSLIQNAFNMLGGLLGILISLLTLDITLSQKVMLYSVISLLLVMLILSVLFFKKIPLLIDKVPIARKWTSKLIDNVFFDSLDQTSIRKIVLYSGLRYVTYIVQFWLVIRAFDATFDTWQVFTGLMIIYALQTILPLTPLMHFTIRGGIAIFVLGAYVSSEGVLTLSSYLLWIINLMIPALLGCYYLYRIHPSQLPWKKKD